MRSGQKPSRRPHGKARRIRIAAAIVCGLIAAALAGCRSVSYYAQAVHGQSQILNRERPIRAVLADPATPAPLKAKLQFVLEARAFAETQLHLPANGHYLAYADLGRPYAVWTVHAAPEFSLTAKRWWYPVVGRLSYRGYFSAARAREYADQLRAQGYDAYVGGVSAYSTLGWFRDPVLNTFIDDDELDLAELLFHELAHQRLFVSGDTDFNEAFATAVAEEGLRRWLEARHDPEATKKYEAQTHRHEEFVRLIAGTRNKLQDLYQTGDTPENLRRRKQQLFEDLQQDYAQLRGRWGGNQDYDRWFDHKLNNAQLNTIETYYHLVPAFREMLRARGGDLEAFYGEARTLGRVNKQERELRLAAWLGGTPADDISLAPRKLPARD